jgi:hypothetical protein
MKNGDILQADIFWKAGVLTVIILIVGIVLGLWIESGRSEEIKSTLTENEIIFNDVRLQTTYYELFLSKNPDATTCSIAFEANLEYNSKIYEEGLKLEVYESRNKISQGMLLERRRYALQQMQFWMNSNKIKEFCKSNYTTILHLWKYDTGNDSSIEMPQKLQSAVLIDLKDKCGSRLMLSNAPVDINLTSMNTITKTFNITKMPALIINNSVVLQGLTDLKELSNYVDC